MVAARRWQRGMGACALALVLSGSLTPRPASAEECHGTLAATALRKLPTPLVVTLELRDPSEQHQKLAALFLKAMRKSGARTEGKPSARLHLSYSVVGGTQERSGVGGVEHSLDSLGGLPDGNVHVLPTIPSRRLGQPQPPPPPAILFLRAELSPMDAERVDWVASLQCPIGGATPEDLSVQMGALIGDIVGRSVPRTAF